MLLLEWTRHQTGGAAGRLVRLNFLPQLLPEAFDFLHEHLTGSVLGTKLFVLPFHRDVEVTPQRGRSLLAAAAFCQSEGGAVFMTPESRCSLHLKQHELRAAGREEERKALEALELLPWYDMYDESDEVRQNTEGSRPIN